MIRRALLGAFLWFAGCSEEHQPPPPFVPARASADSLGCGALRDLGSSVAEQGAGPLLVDGGTAYCPADGLECPLVDTDAGACDGGVDAAAPYARCTGSTWIARCEPRQ